MSDRLIAVLTYNVQHRKTYDALCLLRARGYDAVTVYAQPMTYEKKRLPLVSHRPELAFDIPEPRALCSQLGYPYIEGWFEQTIDGACSGGDNVRDISGCDNAYGKDTNGADGTIFLLCGAGLLPESFVLSHRIVNSHPGFIPFARGLDAYKWSVYENLPIGVTTHFLGRYVDAGEIIERREIGVRLYDTFHSVAQRVYENEIDMLVGAIEKVDEGHDFIVPDGELLRRMPEEKERELFERFERLKDNSAVRFMGLH